MLNNKIVVIGDLHGRSDWKLIVNIEKPKKVIFVGDYFDSFTLSATEQLFNYNELISYKEKNEAEVILLLGNHDIHYFPEISDKRTAGYQYNHAYQISDTIDRTRNHLRMAHQIDNILFTHAGFSPVWLESIFGEGYKLTDGQTYADLINDIWKYKPNTFCFFAPNRGPYSDYGDDVFQSPVWIRPKSLQKASKGLRKEIIQVVGHTAQNKIDIKGKSTGGRYYYVDTLETSGEYLVIEDGVMSVNSCR
jgi:hypothetical protein